MYKIVLDEGAGYKSNFFGIDRKKIAHFIMGDICLSKTLYTRYYKRESDAKRMAEKLKLRYKYPEGYKIAVEEITE